MNGHSLLDRKAIVLANDFVGYDLTAKTAKLSDNNRDALLDLENPVEIVDMRYAHMVASPRTGSDKDLSGYGGYVRLYKREGKYKSGVQF